MATKKCECKCGCDNISHTSICSNCYFSNHYDITTGKRRRIGYKTVPFGVVK